MIRSLRMRMFWGATGASVAVLAILGVSIDQALRRVLREEFDSTLVQKARALASMVEQQGPEVHFDYQRSQFPEFEPAAHPGYFEIWLDGKLFQHSASMDGTYHLADPRFPALTNVGRFTMPDGLQGREVRWTFQPFVEAPESSTDSAKAYPRPTGLVLVAQNTVELDSKLSRLSTMIVGLCGSAAALVGVAMLLVARQTMRPVQRLTHKIESLGPLDLSHAIPPGALPTELVPIVDRLNDLLGRLSEAFNREKTFTADIAHELRTPLAGMLSTLEVCLSRPREPSAYHETIEQCAAVLRQMQGLVERLLLLGRAEGGQLEPQLGNVNLEDLALECWMSLESRAREAGLTVAVETQENHAVIADAQLLQSVLKNLFDNAVSYATRGTRVRIVIRGERDRVITEVISQGHGLNEADLRRIFDRFWRKDLSRSKSGLHAGLGLSLCRRLLALQNGSLSVSLDGEAFIARVELAAANAVDRLQASAMMGTTP